MRLFRFGKEHVKELVEHIDTQGELYIPKQVSEASYCFERYSRFEEIAWEFMRTLVPPKKFFFPQYEVLLEVSDQAEYRVPGIPAARKILFGLHPCDIYGLRICDTFFLKGKPDYYYLERRKRGILIGLSCIPDDHCFCDVMRTDSPDTGYDLFLTDLGDYFLVHVDTIEGDRLLAPFMDRLEDPAEEVRSDYRAYLRKRKEAFHIELDIRNMPLLLEMQKSNKIWEELGERCLACGNCSLGCPTCTCFNVYDRNDFEGAGGQRIRMWDACLYKDYTRVAGGHRFRPDRSERVKNRYYHKQYGFVETFGVPSCVGCGRCTVTCPTGIDFVDVFKRIGA